PGCTTSIWSTLWTPEGPFAPVCVQECLKAWRECWDRGDYEDACCHASKAILLDPKHREAQRVHELTRKIINSLARFDAEWNTTFQLVQCPATTPQAKRTGSPSRACCEVECAGSECCRASDCCDDCCEGCTVTTAAQCCCAKANKREAPKTSC